MGTTQIRGEVQVQEQYLLADGSKIVSGSAFTIGDGTDDRELTIDAGVGKTNQIHLKKESEERWIIRADATAESGSDVGSNFNILNYDDDGVYIGKPFTIKRNTGNMELIGGVSIGIAPPYTQPLGHLFVHDGSANDYGFIEAEGNIYVASNTYHDGADWRAIKTGKAAVLDVSLTSGLRYRGENNVIPIGDTVTLDSLFGVSLDGDTYIAGGLAVGTTVAEAADGRITATESLHLGGGVVVGYVSGAADADAITFYSGTTRMGEIGTVDTTWLRINQTTNKNIYTPRAIRADGGLNAYSSGGLAAGQVSAGPAGVVTYWGAVAVGQFTTQDTAWNRVCQTTGTNTYTPQYFYGNAGLRAGSAAPAPAGGDITFADRIIKDQGGTDYGGNIYVPVTPDVQGTSWWATAKSTGGTTITVSTTFPGIPANVRALNIRVLARDSASHPTTTPYLIVGPDSTTNDNVGVRCHGDNMINENTGICNVTNNTIYAYRVASGSLTIDCWLAVIGYFI